MESYSKIVKTFKETGEGFDKIYNKIQQSLNYFIFSYVKDEDVAKDILSTTMLVVFNNIHKYDEEQSEFNTWVFAIAKNNCLNHLKGNKRFISIDASLNDDNYNLLNTLESSPVLNEGKEHKIQKMFSEIFKKIDKKSVSGKILYFKHIKNLSNIEIVNQLNQKTINKYEQLKKECELSERNKNKHASLCIERDLFYKDNIYSESFVKNDLRKSYKLLRTHFKNIDIEQILN